MQGIVSQQAGIANPAASISRQKARAAATLPPAFMKNSHDFKTCKTRRHEEQGFNNFPAPPRIRGSSEFSK
jgi:hypothetical protein